MTPRAEQLIVRELDKLRAAGHEPIAVLEESIARGWKGVFPPKPGRHQQRVASHAGGAAHRREPERVAQRR
jgi:hypothetical protein